MKFPVCSVVASGKRKNKRKRSVRNQDLTDWVAHFHWSAAVSGTMAFAKPAAATTVTHTHTHTRTHTHTHTQPHHLVTA